MKISFINPQIEIDQKIATHDFLDLGENLGLGLLASYLRKNGITVQILYGTTESSTKAEAIEKLNKFNPDIVGITVMSQTYPVFTEYATLIKNTIDKPIVVGGILPSIFQELFLKKYDPHKLVDYLIFGDGEETILELINHLSIPKPQDEMENINGLIWRKQNLIVKNKKRKIIQNLDKYPFAARDYAPMMIKCLNKSAESLPALRIITSRGCNSQCLFCHINEYYSSMNKKLWRYRSPQNIVSEIESLRMEYSVKHFLFSDDNFLGFGNFGLNRAKELAILLKKRNLDITFCIQTRIDQIDFKTINTLKEAGLIGIDLGIETVNTDSLQFFKKKITLNDIFTNLKKLNNISELYVGIYMLNIHPLATVEETFYNYRFLEMIGYFDHKNRDKEIYRKLFATRLEVTKHTRMCYKLKELGLLGRSLPGNDVMCNFKFQDSKMELFYNRTMQHIIKNGLEGFGDYFLGKIKRNANKVNPIKLIKGG